MINCIDIGVGSFDRKLSRKLFTNNRCHFSGLKVAVCFKLRKPCHHILFSPLHHVRRFGTLLKVVNDSRMSLELRMCHILSGTIDCLRCVVTPRKLHVTNKTKDTIRTLLYTWNTNGQRLLSGLHDV